MHRQHHQLGDLRALAQTVADGLRPCPHFWKSEAFVESLARVRDCSTTGTFPDYSHAHLAAANAEADRWQAEQSKSAGLQRCVTLLIKKRLCPQPRWNFIEKRLTLRFPELGVIGDSL
eukprot:3289684-Pyramimonas_sp.AAC.1